MQLTSARLQTGFIPSLHILVAHVLLNTSSRRVHVEPNLVVADGATTVEMWLQPPNSPSQRTAAELRAELVSRFETNALVLSLKEMSRINPRSFANGKVDMDG